jgi:hypothetical protein
MDMVLSDGGKIFCRGTVWLAPVFAFTPELNSTSIFLSIGDEFLNLDAAYCFNRRPAEKL